MKSLQLATHSSSLNCYSTSFSSSRFCGLSEDLNRSINSFCTANSRIGRRASSATYTTQDSGFTVSYAYTLEPSKNSVNSIRQQTLQLNLCQKTCSRNSDINDQFRWNAQSFKQPWNNDPSCDFLDWTMPTDRSVVKEETPFDAIQSAAQALNQQLNGISFGKTIPPLFRRMRRRQFTILQRLW